MPAKFCPLALSVVLGIATVGPGADRSDAADRDGAPGNVTLDEGSLRDPGWHEHGFCKRGLAARAAAAAAADDRGYDVTHYDIDIAVDYQSVDGRVTATAVALEDGLTDVVLDLYDELAVSVVESPTHGVAGFTHAGNQLTVTLATPVAVDDTFEVAVEYAGTPPSVGGAIADDPFVFDEHGSGDTLTPVYFTLSVPNRSGAWWPCKDVLGDRATVSMAATVAADLVVASNGNLTAVLDGGTQKTYVWDTVDPISTYLVSLAIAEYTVIDDSVRVEVAPFDSVTVPLQWFVYEEDSAAAVFDFERVPQAIQLYSDLFGPYPFTEEKFAQAAVEWGGGMEHQTCVSLGSRFITGTRAGEWVVVHELAHQWFGDDVTLGDWRDVWLNEGFATYAEALWIEETQPTAAAGDSAYHAYMDLLDRLPPPDYNDFPGTIYDPVPLFGFTPYDKGAWVLHMLRHVVGDVAFFKIIKTYAETFAGGFVETADFVAVAEDSSGRNLQPFFTQWIYHEKRPHYSWRWDVEPSGSGYDVIVRIEQTQSHLYVYEMPIDILVRTTAGDSLFVVENTKRREDFELHVDDEPTAVFFDPDNWILKPTQLPSFDFVTLLRSPFPNPAKDVMTLSYRLDAPADVALRIFDGRGRLVRTLVDGGREARAYEEIWDGRDDTGKRLGSGVYYVRLKTPTFEGRQRIVVVR